MDGSDILRVIAALISVLGLIGLFAVFGPKLAAQARQYSLNGQKRRLNIIETLSIDAKRRLVLVALDDREYLLTIGPQSETLITSQEAQAPETTEETLLRSPSDVAAGDTRPTFSDLLTARLPMRPPLSSSTDKAA